MNGSESDAEVKQHTRRRCLKTKVERQRLFYCCFYFTGLFSPADLRTYTDHAGPRRGSILPSALQITADFSFVQDPVLTRSDFCVSIRRDQKPASLPRYVPMCDFRVSIRRDQKPQTSRLESGSKFRFILARITHPIRRSVKMVCKIWAMNV
jgi:hypothetical protein